MKRAKFFLTVALTIGLIVGLAKPLTLLQAQATTHSAHSHIAQTQVDHTKQPEHQPKVRLHKDLGNHHHPISTKSKLAQRYFDQGLTLAYGFNHAEAARLFQQAASLDSTCAMCYWGEALVLGPNINAGMEKDALPQAVKAIQKATERKQYATPKEQAYINALAKRYPTQPVSDRKPFDVAFANAMREVVKQYPDDLDAATLFAEALMDTTPWDYWEENGTPKQEGKEIMATLESVLQRDPNHAGANHLYIHAVEKERPDLGVPSADRLMKLVPNSGHLVHMASHIYIRVGRYHDAVVSNQRGIAADQEYIAAGCHVPGMYPLVYMPHNHHFLWFAASMTGQSKVAIEAAQQTAKVDEKLMQVPELAGMLQHFSAIPLYTYIRFGKWDQILSMPAPAADLKYPNGVWHYARGKALLAKGQSQPAMQELEKLKAIAADPALKEIKVGGFNTTATILNIASNVLAGELAAQRQDYDSAIAHLKTAVQIEDALVYTEPADWYQPTRQALGAVLLKAGRPQAAEAVYREDLKIYPDNGWSLYGLAQSLQAQKKTREAKAVQQQFKQAWKYADVSHPL
uniref:Tetratricopeptide repeat protein n=1 Tax=Oscillatoriales cyanobacterium SpSt-402 TaxID=2282168 RepID=A0A832M2N9_9CYAN